MKQNRVHVFCWQGPALLFFIFRFGYLISGPKSYRDFGETGPLRGMVNWGIAIGKTIPRNVYAMERK